MVGQESDERLWNVVNVLLTSVFSWIGCGGDVFVEKSLKLLLNWDISRFLLTFSLRTCMLGGPLLAGLEMTLLMPSTRVPEFVYTWYVAMIVITETEKYKYIAQDFLPLQHCDWMSFGVHFNKWSIVERERCQINYISGKWIVKILGSGTCGYIGSVINTTSCNWLEQIESMYHTVGYLEFNKHLPLFCKHFYNFDPICTVKSYGKNLLL